MTEEDNKILFDYCDGIIIPRDPSIKMTWVRRHLYENGDWENFVWFFAANRKERIVDFIYWFTDPESFLQAVADYIKETK
jgi:hypothetical protein